MEEILKKLLSGDRTQEGMKELVEVFKNPESVPALFTLLVSSELPDVRQYAAVLLKQRFSKRKRWAALDPVLQSQIKQGSLEALVKESVKSVKNAIAQFIAIILKHESRNQSWPELFNFLTTLCASESINDKELGMYTVGILLEMSRELFEPHALSICNLFSKILNELQDLTAPLGYLTIIAMGHFSLSIEGHNDLIQIYSSLLPRIILIIRALAPVKVERAIECIQYLEEVISFTPAMAVPHLVPLLELGLGMMADKSIEEELRIQSSLLVDSLIKSKKKMIVKLNLVDQILKVLLSIMSEPPEPGDDDDKEDYFTDDPDVRSINVCANQTLDVLALHLPPEKLITPLMKFLEPAFTGNNIYQKKAGYLVIAVLAEGCSEYIRDHYLNDFIKIIIQGINAENTLVRNAALFALGQYSEYLPSDLSMYAAELMPQLCCILNGLSTVDPSEQEVDKDPTIDRGFYALEMFCENLEDALLPYLSEVMERVLIPLERNLPLHYKELSLSAIGSIASAVKGHIMPYFIKIVEYLKLYLQTPESENEEILQVQTIDTLSVLARSLGPEHFHSMAEECLQLGLNFLKDCDDPVLKKVIYSLFASLSSVMKEKMAAYLTIIMEPLLLSVASENGIIPNYEDSNLFVPLDDGDDESEEGEIELNSMSEMSEDAMSGFAVENAYVEEKGEACSALRDFAEHIGEPLLPFIENSFTIVYRIIDYPHEDIRKVAIETLAQLCIVVHKSQQLEHQQALREIFSTIVPKFAELVKKDEDRSVVTVVLDSFALLLKEVGAPILEGEGHLQHIITCVNDVLNKKTACQDFIEEDEEDEAEYDERVMEVAFEIFPGLAKILPSNLFAQYFSAVLPSAISKTKKDYSHTVRASSIGMIAECMCGLSECMPEFVPKLLPILISLSQDKNDQVRNNAIFGIGEFALHGKNCVFPYYTEILQSLSNIIAAEQHGGVLDNICGAIARLILSNTPGVPLPQVLPVLVGKLPLREDFEESKWVYRSLLHLYQIGDESLKSQIQNVIFVCLQALGKEKHGDQETLELIVNLLKMSHKDFGTACEAVTNSNPDLKDTFESVIKS